jgi:hypothetical protein
MGHGETDRVDFRKGLERALARIEALKAELAQRKRADRGDRPGLPLSERVESD